MCQKWPLLLMNCRTPEATDPELDLFQPMGGALGEWQQGHLETSGSQCQLLHQRTDRRPHLAGHALPPGRQFAGKIQIFGVHGFDTSGQRLQVNRCRERCQSRRHCSCRFSWASRCVKAVWSILPT